MAPPLVLNRISSPAVGKATGRSWEEWLALLDARGATALDHRGIVAFVASVGVGPWWQQMVTVGYEQARGMRASHQKADGFSLSVNRTMSGPAAAAHAAFVDEGLRAGWLGEDAGALAITTAPAPRSLRARWLGPSGGRVNVNLYAKGDDRVQVSLNHERLASAEVVARGKAYWGEALGRLAALLDQP